MLLTLKRTLKYMYMYMMHIVCTRHMYKYIAYTMYITLIDHVHVHLAHLLHATH